MPKSRLPESTRENRIKAVVVNALQRFRVMRRARQAFHSGEQDFRQASPGVAVENDALAHLSRMQAKEVIRLKFARALKAHIGWKSSGRLPVPPPFTGEREVASVVSPSGHCHLGHAIDTILAHFALFTLRAKPRCQNSLASYVLFRFVGTKEHAGRRCAYTKSSIPGGRRSERSPRTAKTALTLFTFFLSMCFACSGQ